MAHEQAKNAVFVEVLAFFSRTLRCLGQKKEVPLQPLGAEDEIAKCSVDAGGNDEVQKRQLGQNFFEELRDVDQGIHGRTSWFR